MMTFGWFFLGLYVGLTTAHLYYKVGINAKDWTDWMALLVTLVVLPFVTMLLPFILVYLTIKGALSKIKPYFYF